MEKDVIINWYFLFGFSFLLVLVISVLLVLLGRMWNRGMLSGKYLNFHAKIKSIEFAPNAIITIDSEGLIVSWNRGAENVCGWKESEVLGRSLTIIIPERYRADHNKGLERLKHGGHSRIIGRSVEMTALHRLGEEFPIELTIWAWHEGSAKFFTGIVRNITEQKNAQAEVHDFRDMYLKGESIDESGVWRWDIKQDIVCFSEGFARIYETDEIKCDSGFLLKKVYYEDREKVDQTIHKVFEDKQPYESEYRIFGADGQLKRIHSKAQPYLTAKGQLDYIIGVIHEIK